MHQYTKSRIQFPLRTSFLDYPDSESQAVLVFMMGCIHNCPNCQNKEFQDPHYENGTKELTSDEIINHIKQTCKRNHTNKIVLVGGDPLYDANIKTTMVIVEKLRNEYDICIYTGYDINTVIDNPSLRGWKYIIAGPYIMSLAKTPEKTDEYMQLASSNQEIYNDEFVCLTNENGCMYFN